MNRREFLKFMGSAVIACQLPVKFPDSDNPFSPFADRVIYPQPLRRGDTIGVTAPSAGVITTLEPRLQFSLETLRKLGYQVREGKCLRSDQIFSSSATARAEELQSMLLDDSISALMPPWGGELLIDILSLLDWEALACGKPKWIIGYSDLSTFMLPYTLRTHIATMNGSNLLETPISPPDSTRVYWNDVATLSFGSSFVQRPASRFQAADVDWSQNPLITAFKTDARVSWKCLRHENDPGFRFTASGRLLGGTLDVIGMLAGTVYGDISTFVTACAPEGLLFFLDNADMNTAQYCRMLHHLKLAGWFDHANAILIGRTAGEQLREFTNRDALMDAFSDLPIPILYDLDIGHLPPQMILVNGAKVTVRFTPWGCWLTQTLE